MRSQNLLDQLVTAKVDAVPEKPAIEKTTPTPKPAPQADKSLLSKLASARPDAEPATEKVEPSKEPPPKPVESIKKDVLESLIERKKKSDGSTEFTHPDDGGEH